MSEDKQPTKHTTAWIVTLLTLPVLYLLSSGPMAGLLDNGRIPEAAKPLVGKFYQPVSWLYDNTPLNHPLKAYWYWREDVLYKPKSPAVPK